jgi:hypothetical protein
MIDLSHECTNKIRAFVANKNMKKMHFKTTGMAIRWIAGYLRAGFCYTAMCLVLVSCRSVEEL